MLYGCILTALVTPLCNAIAQEFTMVQTLSDKAQATTLDAGEYQVRFDGSAFATGVYYYTLTATSTSDDGRAYRQTRKLLLIK